MNWVFGFDASYRIFKLWTFALNRLPLMSLDFEKLLSVLSGKPAPRESSSSEQARFNAWFDKLTAGKPSIVTDEIRLTPSNFRSAMRQAFKAGSDKTQ